MRTESEINTELKSLYASHYTALTREMHSANNKLEKEVYKSDRGTNPLLLKVNDEYLKADLKIMFFGQETNFWLGERNEGSFLGEIQPVLVAYQSFYNKNYCYKYGGQFWNGISRFKNMTQSKMPNNKIGLLWNNVIKIGKCGKGFPYKINSITNDYFNVIQEEIKITEPDILLFLSGPNYDHEIKKIFGEYNAIKMGSFSTRQLCKLEFSDHTEFPISFRTYHPNYLWRNGIDNYFNTIIDEIITTI